MDDPFPTIVVLDSPLLVTELSTALILGPEDTLEFNSFFNTSISSLILAICEEFEDEANFPGLLFPIASFNELRFLSCFSIDDVDNSLISSFLFISTSISSLIA